MKRLACLVLLAVFVFSSAAPADLISDNPALVGYWKLDEPAGALSAADASGHGYAGTPAGGVVFGQPSAMSTLGASTAFNGTGKIDVPYQAALNPASFTVSTFARYTGGGSYNSPVTSRNTSAAQGYILYRAADSGGQWQFWTGNGTGWDNQNGLVPAVQDQWVHLAGTYDAATNTKSFYANGHLAVSGSPAGGVVPNNARPLRIGSGRTESSTGDYFFNGNVDNVAVFNQALAHQTISDQYNSFSRYATAVLNDGPVGYWRLGEQTTFNNGLPQTPVWNSADVSAHRGGCFTNVVLNQADTPLVDDIDTAVDFSGAANIKIDIPHSPDFNGPSFTVETWAKVEGGAGSYRSPVTNRDQYASPNYDQRGYLLYADSGNNWTFNTGTGSGWAGIGGGPVVNDVWTHVVGTFEAQSIDGNGVVTGIKTLYVNGVRMSQAVQLYKPNERAPLRIGAGASEGNGAYWFNGKVDETAVYAAPLTRQQVVDHFVTATSPPPRLLGYWALEETVAPGLAADSSGNNLHGQYSAGVNANVAGPAGFDSAAHFAGGDRVNLGQPAELAGLSNNFTLAAWINPDNTSGWKRFLARDRSSANAGFGFGIANAQLAFTTWGVKDYYSGVNVPAGQWSHVALVFDAYNTAHFYLNGELVNSIAGPGAVRSGGLGDFLIGTDSYYSQHFAGLIDDVAIWDGALTSQQIWEHFSGTLHDQMVPEPGTATLVLLSLAGLAGRLRRRRGT